MELHYHLGIVNVVFVSIIFYLQFLTLVFNCTTNNSIMKEKGLEGLINTAFR